MMTTTAKAPKATVPATNSVVFNIRIPPLFSSMDCQTVAPHLKRLTGSRVTLEALEGCAHDILHVDL